MLEVFFNGESYTLFDDITVTNTIDSVCGTFSFTTSLMNPIPFKRGDLIFIKADGKRVLTGYIEAVEGSIDKENSIMTFSGRDILGDLVDSSVPVNFSVTQGSITLKSLCEKIINALGIKADVVDQLGNIKPFKKDNISSSNFGGNAFSFLQKFARKRNVYLTTDGFGNLVFFKRPTQIGFNDKLTENSIVSRNFSYSDRDQFNVIEVGSEDNFSAGSIDSILASLGIAEDGVDRRKSATNSDVREARYLQVQAEETMTDGELLNKAKEEVNVRRARSFNYNCVVPSHEYRTQNLIRVSDKLAGVEGVFLIKSVRYSQNEGGNISELTLCFPESYTVTENRLTKKKSKMEKKVDVPLNTASPAREFLVEPLL